MPKNDKNTNPMHDIITGCVTGAADALSTHPLWTIKTLIQDGLGAKQIGSLVKGNPLILYNGVTANTLSMIPITATRVFLSAEFDRFLGSQDIISVKLLSSGVAGGVSSLISAPTELARTIKLNSTVLAKEGAALVHPYGNTTQIIKAIWQTEGTAKVFKGYGSLSVRDGICTAAFFSGAKIAKEYLEGTVENDFLRSMIAYSAVGIFASFANHPFDTIKTGQHIAFNHYWQLKNSCVNHSGFVDTCKKIYFESGIKGFWSGYPTRGVRFLIGLVVKATMLERMDDFWAHYNENNICLVGDSIDENSSDEG